MWSSWHPLSEFLSSQPELAEKMGRAGRERVRERYTPEAHYEALIGLYERLVDRRRAIVSRAETIRQNSKGSPGERRGTKRDAAKEIKGTSFRCSVLSLAPALPDRIDVPPAVFHKPDAPRRIHWGARCGVEIQRH